jgi:hypothetical protein
VHRSLHNSGALQRLGELEENAAVLHQNAKDERVVHTGFKERLEGQSSKMRALMEALAEEDNDEPEIIEVPRAVSWGLEVQEVPAPRRESTTTLRTERAVEAPQIRGPQVGLIVNGGNNFVLDRRGQRLPSAFSTLFMHGGNTMDGRTPNRSLANTVKTATSTSTQYQDSVLQKYMSMIYDRMGMPRDAMAEIKGLRVDPPEPYDGHDDLVVWERWIDGLLSYYYFYRIVGVDLDSQHMLLAGTRLTGFAATWFAQEVTGPS